MRNFVVKKLMANKNSILLLVSLLFLSFQGKAFDSTSYWEVVKLENAIKKTALDIVQAPVEKWRREATSRFIDTFKMALEYPESFEYPFDSLLTVQKIVSPDKKLKIYTFNLILNNQDHHFYGFIQHKTKEGIEIIELKDTAQTVPNDYLFAELYANEWVGSIYYGIKQHKVKGKILYTVLGYDGASIKTSMKRAEVLWFNESGELTFGYPLFKMDQDDYEPQYRYELEYANDGIIVLRHETTVKKNREMIIYSHLEAKTPDLKEFKEAYYPDGTYDFFLWEKRKWVRYRELRYFDFKEKTDE